MSGNGTNDNGLTQTATESIVFDGEMAPNLFDDFPFIGGNIGPNGNSPTMKFNRGGTYELFMGGRDSSFWSNTPGTRTLLTVGDGLGESDVLVSVLGLSHLNRYDDGTINNFLVNSDGALSFDTGLDFEYTNTSSTRNTTFTINGGSVSTTGSVQGLDSSVENFIEFVAAGGSFSAAYGGDYQNFSSIQNAVDAGVYWKNTSGETLQVINNNNSSFTVMAGSLVPEPSVFAMFLTGSLALLARRGRDWVEFSR